MSVTEKQHHFPKKSLVAISILNILLNPLSFLRLLQNHLMQFAIAYVVIITIQGMHSDTVEFEDESLDSTACPSSLKLLSLPETS